MPNEDKPSAYLQQNILAVLTQDDEYGKIILNTLDVNLFEGFLLEFAERSVDYWRQQNQAPKSHLPDLFADIIGDPHHPRKAVYSRIAFQLMDLAQTVNKKYVLDSLRDFMRLQQYKSSVVDLHQLITAKQEKAIPEADEIVYNLIRNRPAAFDPGLRLSNIERIISYFETTQNEFSTDIHELDSNYITPARGEVFLFLGAASTGKTWFLVDLGRHALNHRKKVLHISLEMGEELIGQRYLETLLMIPKREVTPEVTNFVMQEGKLKELLLTKITPEFDLSSPNIRDELRARARLMGTRYDNLLIKRFPGNSLTPNGLRAYLDQIEVNDHFIPDLLLLDYIGIMKSDAKNYRISMGQNLVDFRAIMVERNIAGVTAHQISREGAKAHQVRGTHIAEDWSMIGTADNIVTYSQTEGEKRFNLARLFVAKARSEKSGFQILITQSYALGQFCRQSVYMAAKYDDLVKEFVGDEEPEAYDS